MFLLTSEDSCQKLINLATATEITQSPSDTGAIRVYSTMENDWSDAGHYTTHERRNEVITEIARALRDGLAVYEMPEK